MTPVWRARVEGPKTIWFDPKGIAEYVKTLDGRRVRIVIEEDIPQRSLNQNAYMHVVFTFISEETGYEMPEVKILMKYLFLSRVGRNGRLYVRETHALNRRECSEFIEQVCRWAAIWLELAIPPAEACAESYAA